MRYGGQYVNVSTRNKIGIIEFNYQQKLNVLSKVFVFDLVRAIEELTCPQVRCIIMRAPKGAGVFSAGHDIDELPQPGCDPLPYDDPLRLLVRAIQHCPKPVIAMVEGGVWGGAFEVIMATDIVIASSTATFAMTAANLGVAYNLAGTHNLMRDTSLHIIKEMLFNATPISAQRAEAVGIVNHVLPAAQLEEFALAMAVFKEELRVLGEANTLNPEQFERIHALRRTAYASQDYQEGLLAFREKRKPVFE